MLTCPDDFDDDHHRDAATAAHQRWTFLGQGRGPIQDLGSSIAQGYLGTLRGTLLPMAGSSRSVLTLHLGMSERLSGLPGQYPSGESL